MSRTPTGLPIDDVLDDLARALADGRNAVLEAPPGAGKTTRVPLALLDAPWRGDGRIIMLEPRRLAARAAARFMSSQIGEKVGGRVGYRVRLDSRVGPNTRIEVVTDGLFLRRLQADPSLDGVAAVIFDEFHERGIDGDLSLALCLEAQAALREDLRLLVMSATLDGARVAKLMDNAPVIRSDGRLFPVEVDYAGGGDLRSLPSRMAACLRTTLRDHDGDILAFLPGVGEIERTAEALMENLPTQVDLHKLHGSLDVAAQDAALQPAPAGRRKVVLATNVAETSLTIDGIRVVVDGGFKRTPRFDPARGFTLLETVRISRASGEQRKGRAGRLATGHCLRLWDAPEQRGMVAHDAPEILATDLTPVALELAVWGVSDAADLSWLDPPPAQPLEQARNLLSRLDALDDKGRVTKMGRAMAGLGVHPRLAHMMLWARERDLGATACLLAALLSERSASGMTGADISDRLSRVPKQILRQAAHWRRTLNVEDAAIEAGAAGRLIAQAFPDRVGQNRHGAGVRYRLSGGGGAELDDLDPLSGRPFLAVGEMSAMAGREPRIRLAAPLDRDMIEADFADGIEERETIAWDTRRGMVVAQQERRFGALVLVRRDLAQPDAEALADAALDGIKSYGIAALPWDQRSLALRNRVRAMRALPEEAGNWPDLSDAALTDNIDDWLLPYLSGITRRDQFASIPLADALAAMLDWSQKQRLEEGAPERLTVPSGSSIRIDYSEDPPVLAVKLQEMFGAKETPRVGWGRLPLVLHLLSPAGRPLQVTQDLEGFWRGSYRHVRSEMKGRYPKHPWPEDPMTAEATRRTKSAAKPRAG